MKEEALLSKAKIFEYWKNSKEYVIVDWYEPACWSCGEWWGGKYDLDLNQVGVGENVRKKIWNSVPLQRCHIIPKSLGGTNQVDNLFLMCHECHDLAPNTKSRELFLCWIKNQGGRKSKEIKHTMYSFNLESLDVEKMMIYYGTNEFKDWMSNNTGLHRNQSYGGSKLTTSTMIAALIEFTKLQKK